MGIEGNIHTINKCNIMLSWQVVVREGNLVEGNQGMRR